MNFSILLIDEKKISELIKISRETYIQTFKGMGYYTEQIVEDYSDVAFSYEKLLEELKNTKNYFYFIKDNNNTTIGYIKLGQKKFPNKIPSIESSICLERFYLKNTLVGLGIGKELFEFVCQKSKELGFSSLWLTVWDYNLKAISFYKKRAMKKVGVVDWVFESQGKKYVDIDSVYYLKLQ